MFFIKSPVSNDGEIVAAHFISSIVIGLDGSGQDGSENQIEFVSSFFKVSSCLSGLFNTLGAQLNIGPASETVFLIPGRFTVSEEDDSVFSFSSKGEQGHKGKIAV